MQNCLYNSTKISGDKAILLEKISKEKDMIEEKNWGGGKGVFKEKEYGFEYKSITSKLNNFIHIT